MKSIIQIFQTNSNEDIIKFSKKEGYKVKYMGNGFFVTKDGYIASVAHVICNEGIISYALWDKNFYRIKIIKREFTKRNENHRDIVIGKIETEHDTQFVDVSNSDDVTLNMSITLKGYFRSSENNELNTKFIEFPTICCDTTHYYNSDVNNPMHNFYSFIIDGERLNGLSGSPIFNEQNKIVGIVKGGNEVIGHAMHIRLIIEILHSLNI